jgi:hypothetical protein
MFLWVPVQQSSKQRYVAFSAAVAANLSEPDICNRTNADLPQRIRGEP